MAEDIAPHEAAQALADVQQGRRSDFVLLDVREPVELRLVAIEGARHVPMREVPARLAELDPAAEIAVLCHVGGRSAAVVAFLARHGFARARNVAGGIDRWAREGDPRLARY